MSSDPRTVCLSCFNNGVLTVPCQGSKAYSKTVIPRDLRGVDPGAPKAAEAMVKIVQVIAASWNLHTHSPQASDGFYYDL